jgi:hypothetical protein
MRADIDNEQRLCVQPESLTENTALHTWWYALPIDLRQQMEGRVVPMVWADPQGAITATEVQHGMQALVEKSAKDIEPAWQEFGMQLAKAIDESMRAARSKGWPL